MSTRSRLFCLAVVLLAAISMRARAQSSHRPMGVYDDDTGQPIEGVEVMDLATGTSAMTTRAGKVNLDFMSAAGGLVRVRKVGYAAQTIAVAAADTDGMMVNLKRVVELPAVVTRDSARHYLSPALRGFEERRKSGGFGYYIDETALRKEETRPLSNVLIAHANGVNIRQASGANFLLKSHRCSSGGQPDVYLDGVPIAHIPDRRWSETGKMRPGDDFRGVPIDISQFHVSDLAAVEYYPDNASVPVQFRGTSAGCGALMLWTRER